MALSIVNMKGDPMCKLFKVVMSHECIVCEEEIPIETLVYAVGPPYFCLIHELCLPFFDYDGGYPHAFSYQQYANLTNQTKKTPVCKL